MLKFSFIALFLTSVVSMASMAQMDAYGAFKNISINDPGVITAAKFAIKTYNQQNSVNWTILEILTARKQLVAGFNYEITFQAKRITCKSNCAKYECDVCVWTKEWINFIKLTMSDCTRI
jgi:hypothetical protein